VSDFTFETFHGIKTAVKVLSPSTSKTTITISMRFPSSPVSDGSEFPESVKIGFAKALGINPSKIVALGRNDLMDMVVEVESSVDFSADGGGCNIDAVELMNISPAGTRSQVVTSSGKSGVDFLKRVWAYGGEGE